MFEAWRRFLGVLAAGRGAGRLLVGRLGSVQDALARRVVARHPRVEFCVVVVVARVQVVADVDGRWTLLLLVLLLVCL